MSLTCQCFATSNNGRCINKSIAGSKHCALHRTVANKLYIKYKTLCDQTNKVDLTKKSDSLLKDIGYIMNCYNIFNRAFQARLKHRKYAIAPDLYDEGHDYQFTKLKEKIDECEILLEKLYMVYEKNKKDDEIINNIKNDKIITSIVKNDKIITSIVKNDYDVKEKIKTSKKQRLEKEQEINIWMEKYIKENQEILEKRQKMINILAMCISRLFRKSHCDCGECETKLVDVEVIIAMMELLLKLNDLGYFDKNFRPKQCNYPGCKCGARTRVSLGHDFFCGQEKSVEDYIKSHCYESLKFVTELCIFNEAKILPFIDDICNLYEKYEHNIVMANVELMWKSDRLNLVEPLNPNKNLITYNTKPSQEFATQRLKNKYYEQEILNKVLNI